jgi:hypothetical protein
LARLSSGYPRIVEALSVAYPTLIEKNPKSLQDALPSVHEALRCRGRLLNLDEKDLSVPLLSQRVSIDSELPSKSLCRVRVENGSFIRPVSDGAVPEEETSAPFIPHVPLLPLFLWASENQKSSQTVKVLYEFMRHCFDCTRGDRPSNFYGAGFEKAHTYYLALRALLEKHVQTVYYFTPDEKVNDMEALIQPTLMVTDEFTDITAPFSYFFSSVLQETSTLILHVGRHFPGCDTLVFEKKQDGVHLSLYQMKYYPNSTFEESAWKDAMSRNKNNWVL